MEIWDLYTRDRQKTGQTIVRGTEIPEGLFRLVVHICIFNGEGQMLIQRRQTTKSGWPDLWDVTVGGHAIAGETSSMAAERETMEELGISISLREVRPALTPTFPNGFDDIYCIEQEVELSGLTLQEEEVKDVRWATKEEIFALIDDGLFIPYHKSLIDLMFFLRNHPEVHTE